MFHGCTSTRCRYLRHATALAQCLLMPWIMGALTTSPVWCIHKKYYRDIVDFFMDEYLRMCVLPESPSPSSDKLSLASSIPASPSSAPDMTQNDVLWNWLVWRGRGDVRLMKTAWTITPFMKFSDSCSTFETGSKSTLRESRLKAVQTWIVWNHSEVSLRNQNFSPSTCNVTFYVICTEFRSGRASGRSQGPRSRRPPLDSNVGKKDRIKRHAWKGDARRRCLSLSSSLSGQWRCRQTRRLAMGAHDGTLLTYSFN